ncbi:uncharacterized protein LOC125501674 isoform X1 [Athalia rosae]|uniref:uncharacterized protein LOC125500953 isoform X1 n=1 Tax=Athalia rosae TaxID=37344 RepID=UPI0020335379|nr:uncharacterized protein LOC125500953 isoform X1 [Athalia rosae]XP_048513981.1 uncharacterized protein LOC125501674 isoform X1 [Athalia rosae]
MKYTNYPSEQTMMLVPDVPEVQAFFGLKLPTSLPSSLPTSIANPIPILTLNTTEERASSNISKQDSECQRMFHESLQLASCRASCNDQGSSNSAPQNFKWSNATTMLLIELRLEANAEFMKTQKSFNKHWDKILTIFAQHGYSVTREELKSKWKNLLVTYNRNVDKLAKTGESSIEWEFFEKMHDVLGDKRNVEPPPNTLGSTLQINNVNKSLSNNNKNQFQSDTIINTDKENSENDEDTAIDSEVKDDEEQEATQLKIKLVPTLRGNLQKKKKTNRKRKSDVIYEIRDLLGEKKEKALAQQRSMWEEKKEIEQNRTNAILALAEAIRGSKKRRNDSDDES